MSDKNRKERIEEVKESFRKLAESREEIADAGEFAGERAHKAGERRMGEFRRKWGVTERTATIADALTIACAGVLLYFVAGTNVIIDAILIMVILFSVYTQAKRLARKVRE